jgi:hypothetical protein
MAKDQNLLPTKYVTLSSNPQVVKYLEKLVMTGFYGKNVAEAAERILAQELEARVREEQSTDATRSAT